MIIRRYWLSFLIFSFLNSVDDEGRTPLMLAIKKQNIYIIKHLLAKGASKICVDKKGNTVFHYAANSNKDVVKVFFNLTRTNDPHSLQSFYPGFCLYEIFFFVLFCWSIYSNYSILLYHEFIFLIFWVRFNRIKNVTRRYTSLKFVLNFVYLPVVPQIVSLSQKFRGSQGMLCTSINILPNVNSFVTL